MSLPTFACKILKITAIAMVSLFAGAGVVHAQWINIGDGSGNSGTAPGAGPAAATTCLLLTDGSVMCQEDTNPCCSGVTPTNWWRLTPDQFGNYTTGNWSQLQGAPGGFAPLYYCSAVLPDGRVVVIGGEDNATSAFVEQTAGYVFDPTANGGSGQWSGLISLGDTGWTQVGDSMCMVQADKTFIIGGLGTSQIASLNTSTLTLSLVNSPNLESSKADANSEEGWTLLPDKTILTVDACCNGATSSEIYDPSKQLWSSAGSTGVSLPTNDGMKGGPDIGPQIMRPDGTVIAFGATGNTSIYNTATKTWSPGPNNFQNGDVTADAPAALLSNGHVLLAASPYYATPVDIYDFDGTTLNLVKNPPNASNDISYDTRMLLLPTGQVLFTDGTGDVEIYSSGTTYLPAWQPTITSAPASVGQGETYTISGTQFNGLSAGSAYGDDASNATNYPLVRITNTSSGHVQYARTHDHSTMAVATGSAIVSTSFDAPASLELGPSTLVVVANGIPSAPFSINVGLPTILLYVGAISGEFSDGATVQALLLNGPNGVSGETVTFSMGSGAGSETCSATTDGTGRAACVITPTQAPSVYPLTATFAGDATYAASAAAAAFLVTKDETALAFTAGSATTSDYHDAATVQAVLTDPDGGAPIAGKMVQFALGSGAGSESCSATTNGSGVASCSITPTQAPSVYPLTATFAGDATYAASAAAAAFLVTKDETALAFTAGSATTSDYHDAATVQAVLTDPDGGAPIAGKMVQFALGSGAGSESCSATTNGSGVASCSITPTQAAGSYTLSANFAGDADYLSSTASSSFTVTKEETTVKFSASSPTVIATGHPATFSAILLEDGTTPIQGRTLTITLGTQSCLTGASDATGTASCTITLSSALGPGTVSVQFAGDAFYLPSSASEPVLVFAFLASGSMVIGNGNAALGNTVNFWGANWATDNTLSGGPAPNAFKGFASTAPQSCGGAGWSSTTGTSSDPPATIPSYMGVVASSSVLAPSIVTGDVPIIVVVKTNAGYGPAAGQSGTGVVVAFYCH